MNLEFRKEQKEMKGTPRKEHFISSLLLSFAYFSNCSRPLGDQTSILSGPGLNRAELSRWQEGGSSNFEGRTSHWLLASTKD